MPLTRFHRLPIRHKLLALVLVPLLLVLPLLGGVLLVWGNAALDSLLIGKVRSDLAVAEGYFDRVRAEVGSGTQAVAGSHALVASLQDAQAVRRLLQEAKQRHGLDFLNLLTSDAQLWVGEAGIAAPGVAMPRLVADLTGAQASVAVLGPEQFRVIAPRLAGRVGIPLLRTANAAPTERRQEDRAMVLIARAPVLAADGRVLGHLQGGVLLNRNLALIDHINEIVYPEGSLPFGSKGTATLFLDDVRISTNVRLFGREGDRAIGTRVSRAVREAVLGRGSTWLDRAFVVNDWYVSGYLPLADRNGQRVGMLYVGYLERPFNTVKLAVLGGIGAIFFAVMTGAAWISLRWARGIFKPLERMAQTMQAVEGGRLDARVGPVGAQDEIGRLAAHFDQLLDVIDDKTQALQRSNEELDAKVVERTRELEAAQRQLVRSEKLAAVGQLTASIAHEVNNPIAVIQGNLDLVREILGPDAEPVRGELKLVDQQIERMRLIVTQLLQFARPTEYAGYVDTVDLARLVDDCLVLVDHLRARSQIEVLRELEARRSPAINRQELQQVLINLLVNAIHAMPGGGTLKIRTHDWNDKGVAVEIADTGPGLPPEVMSTLFQPFITTKKDGTGLGLWISRSLVERYGGDITARNAERGGAVFTVWLPAA